MESKKNKHIRATNFYYTHRTHSFHVQCRDAHTHVDRVPFALYDEMYSRSVRMFIHCLHGCCCCCCLLFVHIRLLLWLWHVVVCLWPGARDGVCVCVFVARTSPAGSAVYWASTQHASQIGSSPVFPFMSPLGGGTFIAFTASGVLKFIINIYYYCYYELFFPVVLCLSLSLSHALLHTHILLLLAYVPRIHAVEVFACSLDRRLIGWI